jgi:hypothetical protein
MKWNIEMVVEFEDWLRQLDDNTQDAVLVIIRLLQEQGPALSRPHADTLKNSKLTNLKELRTQYKGKPYRVLYVFDPARSAILLLGGVKSSKKNWYKTSIPLAEKRYEGHLKTLKNQ